MVGAYKICETRPTTTVPQHSSSSRVRKHCEMILSPMLSGWSIDQTYRFACCGSSWLSASAPAVSISKDDLALDIPIVALAPFGPIGSLKKPISIAASNGANFSLLELLWLAASIQGPIASKLGHGVGVYRLGYFTGRPLFYLLGISRSSGHCLILALQPEALSPPPIWLMRQAGRYLPEYRATRHSQMRMQFADGPCLEGARQEDGPAGSHPISRPCAREASSERFQGPISAVRVSGSRSRSLWAASSISAIALSVSAIAWRAYCPRWR